MCQQTSEHRDTVGMDPNGKDPEDVWRIAVDVIETRGTFVVVRLRANSLEEARARAIQDVEQLCETDRLDEHIDSHSEWEHESFEANGLAQVQGHIADYNVDIDKTEEPTDAERELAKRQTTMPGVQDA
jgi:hypothetical protein